MLRRRSYYIVLFIWSIIYIGGTLVAPLGPTRFNITPAKTHLLQISFALPIVLIWAVAVYGAERFKCYAISIKRDRDGRAMNTVANGLALLIISVMSGGLSAILRPWALRDGWLEAFTIGFNYFQVVLPLIAYWVMFKGSNQLRTIAIKKKDDIRSWMPVILTVLLIGVVYLGVLLSYQYRNSTPNPNKYNSFYLPDYLIVLSLALPYLVGWALGIKAVANIVLYQRRVQGIIYRAALFRLALGVLVVISFAVILQLLVALSAYLSKASLGAILLIIYLIILIYSVGFLMIASGTKRLNAIESAGVK